MLIDFAKDFEDFEDFEYDDEARLFINSIVTEMLMSFANLCRSRKMSRVTDLEFIQNEFIRPIRTDNIHIRRSISAATLNRDENLFKLGKDIQSFYRNLNITLNKKCSAYLEGFIRYFIEELSSDEDSGIDHIFMKLKEDVVLMDVIKQFSTRYNLSVFATSTKSISNARLGNNSKAKVLYKDIVSIVGKHM